MGKITGNGDLKDEARSAPPAGDTTNASTPKEERAVNRLEGLDSGPKVDDATGAYMPARYVTRERVINLVGGRQEVIPGNIREDR